MPVWHGQRAGLRLQARAKEHAAKDLQGAALENQIRKNRVRWLKTYLTEAGTRRAKELGWPNTYTFTKSMGESLLVTRGAGLPIAVVRPDLFRLQPLHVDVEVQGELTRGMTVFDRRLQPSGNSNAAVALDVDSQAVVDYMTQLLC